MKKSILVTATLTLLMLLTAFGMNAQSPVSWKATVNMTSKTEGVIILTANIDKGWHVYGFNQPEDGPVSTVVTMAPSKNVTFKSKLEYSPKLITMNDEMFGMEVTYWENQVTLKRKFKLAKGKTPATCKVTVEYMACNDTSCQPPKTETFDLKLR